MLCAPAGVGVGQAQNGASPLVDFLAAVVADEHGLPGHEGPPFPGGIALEFYAAFRVSRTRHERSSESVDCSSWSRPISRAVTIRKFRGLKSSIVRPSRYCWTTAGETYEARAT